MMTLNRNIDNFFTENEQAAFGTGVLVDGLDFSDDKMLIGRTFAYSDTQRYRIGPNYLQLPGERAAAPQHEPARRQHGLPRRRPRRQSPCEPMNRRRWAGCGGRMPRTVSIARTWLARR